MSMAQLKNKSYDNVIEYCNKVLNKENNNIKAIYRKGYS